MRDTRAVLNSEWTDTERGAVWHLQEKEYRNLRLDPNRYQQLVKDVHRYQRYLAAKAAH